MDTLKPGGPTDPASVILPLLEQIRRRFYAGQDERAFHRDRRRLLYALTWPATWLEHRALTCASARYRALLADRLDDIAAHGDPARYGAYFPTYLLRCVQDWFHHHGDELDGELKHIRNALEQILASLPLARTVQRDAHHIELLTSAHRLIRPDGRPRQSIDARQLSLF